MLPGILAILNSSRDGQKGQTKQHRVQHFWFDKRGSSPKFTAFSEGLDSFLCCPLTHNSRLTKPVRVTYKGFVWLWESLRLKVTTPGGGLELHHWQRVSPA